MTDTTPTYRPHDPGHDYYSPGLYLITLVVRNRRTNARMFGTLNNDIRHPGVILNELGQAVMECWNAVPAFEESKGRKVAIHSAICMPDHFHGVIEVKEKMPVSLGQIIWGFKVSCTKRWRSLQHPKTAVATPTTAEPATPPTTAGPSLAAHTPDLHRMSKKQRAAYYAAHPEAQQPLWDDNYDDTICLSDPLTGEYSQRHFNAMLQYVADNPRRAIFMRQRPTFMQRCLHVRITTHAADGTPVEHHFAAFGNLFLLRWARKVQVFCHRLARCGMLTPEEWQKATATPDTIASFEKHARQHKLGRFDRDWYRCPHPSATTAIDYTRTSAYRHQHDAWLSQVMAGQTVIVTPGISRGEQQMKDECLTNGYPLIHLQKEPIGSHWKPEKTRFEACTQGRLLILAPWHPDTLGDVNSIPSSTDYSIFHNLNTLAAELSLFDGEATLL